MVKWAIFLIALSCLGLLAVLWEAMQEPVV